MMEIRVTDADGNWVLPPPDELRRLNHAAGIDDAAIADLEAIERGEPFGDIIELNFDGRRVQPQLTDGEAD